MHVPFYMKLTVGRSFDSILMKLGKVVGFVAELNSIVLGVDKSHGGGAYISSAIALLGKDQTTDFAATRQVSGVL